MFNYHVSQSGEELKLEWKLKKTYKKKEETTAMKRIAVHETSTSRHH